MPMNSKSPSRQSPAQQRRQRTTTNVPRMCPEISDAKIDPNNGEKNAL